MASRKVVKGNERKAKPGSKAFPITCTDECGATTEMVFSGEGPYKEATLSAEGWAVLNSPEDGSVAFLCPTCFKRLEPEDLVDEDDITDKDYDS
jgi:hypothetical protein